MTDIDKSDRVFYCYTKTENVKHFERHVVTDAMCECFYDE